MQLDACFLLFLLGITLIQAGPTPKVVEKKTLAEDTKAPSKEENMKIEEAGEDKERSKKAALCLQLEPGHYQSSQLAVNSNPNINQVAVHSVPLTLQAQAIPQQVQTLSFVQPMAQSLPQANLVIPQQMVQPVQTLQIVPQSQPCAHPAAVNIIQTSSPVQAVQKPQPTPKPTPAPAKQPEQVTEPPKPMRIEQEPQPLPAPQESFAMVPAAPPCEHVMMLPQPEHITYVQVPQVPQCSNPLHGRVTECTCQKVEPVGAAMMSVINYPSNYARSAMMMPRHMDINPTPMGLSGKSRTFVSVNTATQPLYQPHHQKMYQKMQVQGVENLSEVGMMGASYPAPGLMLGGYPPMYRALSPMQQPIQPLPQNFMRSKYNYYENPMNSEVHNLMQTNKIPREADSSQLSPEKAEEPQKQEGTAMLIDGRRNTRSNKEEKKEVEPKPKKN